MPSLFCHSQLCSGNNLNIIDNRKIIPKQNIAVAFQVKKTFFTPSPKSALLAARKARSRGIVAATLATERQAPYMESQLKTKLCTSLTASTVDGMLLEANEALAEGADIVELRIDFLDSIQAEADLPRLFKECPLPAIVTYRPDWEAGKYSGPEAPRLLALKHAAALGFAFVDIELKASKSFFESKGNVSDQTQIIVSSHDYDSTPSTADLMALVDRCKEAGADIVKFATMAKDISDAHRVLSVLRECAPQHPIIALAMGERGQVSRILAPKYGGYLTFGSLSPERQSAPGQPTLRQLRELYRLGSQTASTKVFGIVGNPVSHSRSPAIHNGALERVGYDAVYVPYLVDDMNSFLDSFSEQDYAGFSVTIPHKEAALKAATEVDPVAGQIGAANTLVRVEGGGLRGYNTDWSAAIAAIEEGLQEGGSQQEPSPLQGKRVVVVGAGGAGRALAFGAAAKGAGAVIIANRNKQRGDDLAAELAGRLGPQAQAQSVSLDDVAHGAVAGDVLVNTTAVGMYPKVDESPVSAAALGAYELVFDAVYTPLHTRLLQDARAAGCKIVTGDTMFVGQAATQFQLFTGKEAPVELMQQVVLDSLK